MPDPAWPATVAVAVPTVAARAAILPRTLDRLAACGATPVVHLQDPDWPLGHESHTRHVTWLLRHVLDVRPDATHVLLAEDDIDVDPALPGVLPQLLDGRVWSLWSPALTFLPGHVRTILRAGQPLPARTAVPARPLRQWHGTLAVLAPRDTLASILAEPAREHGWDLHLRRCLHDRGEDLWLSVPDLVEHRGTLSVAAFVGTSGRSRSATFSWPVMS